MHSSESVTCQSDIPFCLYSYDPHNGSRMDLLYFQYVVRTYTYVHECVYTYVRGTPESNTRCVRMCVISVKIYTL